MEDGERMEDFAYEGEGGAYTLRCNNGHEWSSGQVTSGHSTGQYTRGDCPHCDLPGTWIEDLAGGMGPGAWV